MFHVPPSWSLARSVTSRHLLRSPRYLSTPVPDPKPRPTNIPPDTPVPSKLKLDLRPAPIKPSANAPTVSATHIPLKPTVPLSKADDPTPSLRDVKETARRDIEDAEAHGVLKPPPEGANWFRSTLHKAIQIVKFYYYGIKLIFTRQSQITSIRSRINNGGLPLTRSEFRFMHTQKSDYNKLLPFLFIALLLEEAIPLIAIYAPFMLPSTCILPSQRERIDAQRADKALAFAVKYNHTFSLLKRAESPAGHLPLSALYLNDAAVALCGVLRISTVGIDTLRIWRIRKHLQFIAEDDQLLIGEGRLEVLSPRELEEALSERGMVFNNLSPKAMRLRLNRWLDSVGDSTSEARRLYLMVAIL